MICTPEEEPGLNRKLCILKYWMRSVFEVLMEMST